MNAPELPIGTTIKRNPAATSTPSPKAEGGDVCGCRPTSPASSEQPSIAETDLWLNYSCAALTGLLARQNTQFTKEQLAVTACEYADLMADGFRKRFVG